MTLCSSWAEGKLWQDWVLNSEVHVQTFRVKRAELARRQCNISKAKMVVIIAALDTKRFADSLFQLAR